MGDWSLESWLKQLELSQYLQQFAEMDSTRQQCSQLDEHKLNQVGITLPGHQKRILSNLPPPSSLSSEDNAVYMNLPPVLPPKSRTVSQIEHHLQAAVVERPVPKPRMMKKKNVPAREEVDQIGPVLKPREKRWSVSKPSSDSSEENNSPFLDKTKTSAEAEDPHYSFSIPFNDLALKSSSPAPYPSQATSPNNGHSRNANENIIFNGQSSSYEGAKKDVQNRPFQHFDSNPYEQIWSEKKPERCSSDLISFESVEDNCNSEIMGSQACFDLPHPPFSPPPIPVGENYNAFSKNAIPSLPVRKVTTQQSEVSDADGDPFKDSTFASECADFNNSSSVTSDSFSLSSYCQKAAEEGAINAQPNGFASPSFDPLCWVLPPPLSPDIYSLAQEVDEDDSSDEEDFSGLRSDTSLSLSHVRVLPAQSPKTLERSGYLYKQGGVQGNKGWRKRWLIFNGKDLKYYANNRSQLSKRILPVSCMKDVKQDIKNGDTKHFKFTLITTSRKFLFASDTLEENILWCSTLKQAIDNFTPTEDCVKEGGEMHNPEKEGFIKFEGKRNKLYMAIKGSTLCVYNSLKDFAIASPIYEINMTLASVKDLGKGKLQLSTHYHQSLLLFDSVQEAKQWKSAIEDAITEGFSDDTVLQKVTENPSNNSCADCGAEKPRWASVNLGIVLCLKCAGIHREFGVQLSKIKSLCMDTTVWTPSLIEMMKIIGNENSHNFWKFNLSEDQELSPEASSQERRRHLENKYKHKMFVCFHHLKDNKKTLNKALHEAAQTDDVFKTMQILFSGADLMYHPPGAPDDTAFQAAKRTGQRIQMEFLYQNGGDKSTQVSTNSSDEAMAMFLRGSVTMEGYLYKTGSKMKDFLRRWCILERCTLTYYPDKKSAAAKDAIETDTIISIQATLTEKYDYSFELSTVSHSNRIYLFAADTKEERHLWMRTLARVICPVHLIENILHMDFDLAGYFSLKDGPAAEWQLTWLMVFGKQLRFVNKDGVWDLADLRKACSLAYLPSGMKSKAFKESEDSSSKNFDLSPHFVVAFPGRALYIQSILRHDTLRLFKALQFETANCSAILEDQQLTSDDIPVIVDKCITYIMANGLTENGIYRLSGTDSKVNRLLQFLRQDVRSLNIRREEFTVHEVSNALRRFFRQLDDPVMTKRLYQKWVETAGIEQPKHKLQWYKYLLDELPRVNYCTLKKLVTHLWNVSKNQHENKMGIKQLSIVFGPALFTLDKDQVQGARDMLGYNCTNREIMVVGDLIKYHEFLFEVKQEEKRVEEQVLRAIEKLETIKNKPVSADNIIMGIHVGTKHSQPVMIKVSLTMNVGELLEKVKQQASLQGDKWALHEMVSDWELERPLHPLEIVREITDQWINWDPSDTKSASLCLKSSETLARIKDHFDPRKALFGELEYSEKKSFKKYIFEFTQSKLSYYKDAKVMNAVNSWNVEVLSVYLGMEKKRNTKKCGFTFIVKSERTKRSKEMPFFGKSISFPSEDEMLSWFSGMLYAQFPAST